MISPIFTSGMVMQLAGANLCNRGRLQFEGDHALLPAALKFLHLYFFSQATAHILTGFI